MGWRRVAFACVWLVACSSDSHEGQAAASSCGPGEELREGKCVACPAGAGCGCLDGFLFDVSTRTCEPVLPASPCPPNSMSMLGKRECQPVGVAMCAKGFTSDGAGGCDAILPKDRCPVGLVALPGETKCREIAPCAEGLWGDIADEPGAVHVQKDYAGTDSDGSRARPFTTIGAAIAKAAPGALVALAEGNYAEDVYITKALRLVGVCPSKVTITGQTAADAALVLGATAAGANIVVQRLSVTGPGDGIGIGAGGGELDRVIIHDTGDRGIVIQGRKTVVVGRNVLVERASKAGVFVFGAKATFDGIVVRDTQPRPADKKYGRGFEIFVDQVTKLPSDVTVRGSLVERNRSSGFTIAGSKVTIEASIVRDTESDLAQMKGFGEGIATAVDPLTKLGADLVLRGSLVERNRAQNISVFGSKATIEATVVRDGRPVERDNTGGQGIYAHYDRTTGIQPDLVVKGCQVLHNLEGGIALHGGKARVEGTIVRDTSPQVSNKKSGVGIYSEVDVMRSAGSELTILATLIERSHASGITLHGTKALVEASVVRDTRPELANSMFGRGIDASVDESTDLASELVTRRALIERCSDVGIGVFGSTATIEATLVRDIVVQKVDSQFGDGIGVFGAPYGVLSPANVTVRGTRVSGCARGGLFGFGDATVWFGGGRLACNGIDLAKIAGLIGSDVKDARFDTSAGGNGCGCDTVAACKVEARESSEIPAQSPLVAD